MDERTYERPTDESLWLWPADASLPGEDAEVAAARADWKNDPNELAAGWLDKYLLDGDSPRGAVIVCPGGGYSIRAPHEAAPIARRFNDAGLHAFVCHYHTSPSRHPLPLLDAARAVRIVRKNAAEWGVSPDKIAILGFSAGGHLVAHLGTHYDKATCDIDDEIQQVSARPDAVIPCYAVLDPQLHVGSYKNLLGDAYEESKMDSLSPLHGAHKTMPPVFMWSTADDQAVPVESSLNFAKKLRELEVPFELHVYPHGRHGLGLAEETKDVSGWPQLCADWLKSMGW